MKSIRTRISSSALKWGKGRIVTDGVPYKVKSGNAINVPTGVLHNLICARHDTLELYRSNGPSHNRDQPGQITKAEMAGSGGFLEGQATEQGPGVLLVQTIALC